MATETARQTVDYATETARNAAETARHTAREVQERAADTYQQATDWSRDSYQRASNWAADQYDFAQRQADYMRERSMAEMARARQNMERVVTENPVMIGVIGLAAGMLIGSLLPRTRKEDKTFGRWSDEMREQGYRYAREMAKQGREFVEDAFTGDPRYDSPRGRDRDDQGRDDRNQDRGGDRGGPSGNRQRRS